MMQTRATTLIGKTVRKLSRLRGGGSALPGLVVEKLDKKFLARSLQQLPKGVVVISGTNGKTTTTKMVVEMLRAQGLKVFTNQSGSNFKRGVISAILAETNWRGKLPADIAVLELDEAHAVHFVREVPPKFCLLLNVMRDQLDRFGEIDTTAAYLQKIAEATTSGVVTNREDSRLLVIGRHLPAEKVRYFGASSEVMEHFPSDDELYGSGSVSTTTHKPAADVELKQFADQTAVFRFDDTDVTRHLRLNGAYNVLNAAAALALVRTICGDQLNTPKMLRALELIEPAFGRGEKLIVRGQPLELILVKNPSGFRLGLSSFDAAAAATMIAINDNYADGRDMSWLWDVDFSSLKNSGVACVSGIRAYDMALRLRYDEVVFDAVQTDMKVALKKFLSHNQNSAKRIFCTYTAMLELRRELSKYTTVERAL